MRGPTGSQNRCVVNIEFRACSTMGDCSESDTLSLKFSPVFSKFRTPRKFRGGMVHSPAARVLQGGLSSASSAGDPLLVRNDTEPEEAESSPTPPGHYVKESKRSFLIKQAITHLKTDYPDCYEDFLFNITRVLPYCSWSSLFSGSESYMTVVEDPRSNFEFSRKVRTCL